MPRARVEDVVANYNEAKRLRNPHEQQFRMNAAYCLPRDYGRWSGASTQADANRTSQDVQARFAFDNTGVRAVAKFGAICKRLINPDNIKYHKVIADNDALMKIPAVRMYFENVTDFLFRKRSNPASGFGTAQQEMYTSIGVYGTGPKSITWSREFRTYRYKAWPLYDVFFLVDDEGRVTDIFRRFHLTRRQWKRRFPNQAFPRDLAAVDDNSPKTVECIHYVCKRGGDYDAKALDTRRMKWISSYVCVNDPCYIGEEDGAVSCVYNVGRTMTVAGDLYGYAPAEMAFAALGGVNAMKKTYIKMGHKAVDPPLLAHDDGVLSGRIDIRPGKVTYGGINQSGQKLVQELQTGANFQVAETLIQDERSDINDAFMVTLFEILTENPEMTAAQVYERIAEKAALFAPTMAALQEQDQGPQVDREILLAVEYGQLPPMPPELIEAAGEYKMAYTNPMNKALHATEVSGFVRWVEMLAQAASLSGDPSALDWVNWDEAAPDVGDKMDVRNNWINIPDAVKAIRDSRAKQMEQEQMIKAAPAMASVAATAGKMQQGARQ